MNAIDAGASAEQVDEVAGLRADLVAVNKDTRAIEMVLAGGRVAHLSGDAAARFASAAQVTRMAAE